MAPVFDRKRYPRQSFVPEISDPEWDARVKGIRENIKEVQLELAAIGLATLSGQPGFANLVPALIKGLELNPSDDISFILSLFKQAQDSIRRSSLEENGLT